MEQPVIRIERVEQDEAFNDVFEIRTRVFVDEQSVPQDDEYDGFDHLAQHYLARFGGEPAGTCRWRITPIGKVRLERIAVLEQFRGKGIGRALIQTMMADIPKGKEVFGHVPEPLVPYYQQHGFEPEGEVFEEAGMDHRRVVFMRA